LRSQVPVQVQRSRNRFKRGTGKVRKVTLKHSTSNGSASEMTPISHGSGFESEDFHLFLHTLSILQAPPTSRPLPNPRSYSTANRPEDGILPRPAAPFLAPASYTNDCCSNGCFLGGNSSACQLWNVPVTRKQQTVHFVKLDGSQKIAATGRPGGVSAAAGRRPGWVRLAGV
jgi:hypothetical protein